MEWYELITAWVIKDIQIDKQAVLVSFKPHGVLNLFQYTLKGVFKLIKYV